MGIKGSVHMLLHRIPTSLVTSPSCASTATPPSQAIESTRTPTDRPEYAASTRKSAPGTACPSPNLPSKVSRKRADPSVLQSISRSGNSRSRLERVRSTRPRVLPQTPTNLNPRQVAPTPPSGPCSTVSCVSLASPSTRFLFSMARTSPPLSETRRPRNEMPTKWDQPWRSA